MINRLPVRFLKKTLNYAIKAFLVYCALVLFLFVQQRNFIYFPSHEMPTKDAIYEAGNIQEVNVTTSDNIKLSAWLVKAEHTRATILFFHGNGGNIVHRYNKVLPYVNAGYDVLLAEYRGYGSNKGMPTEQGLYKDAEAYYNWLTENTSPNFDIILYGESLGTGVAVELLSNQKARAIILETPYTKLSEAAQKRYFFIPFIEALMKDKYNSIEKIKNQNTESLFLIAKNDEVLGAETGISLFNAANAPKTLKIFDEAQHNTVYNYGAADIVLQFLTKISHNNVRTE